jgi:hypothetical protein
VSSCTWQRGRGVSEALGDLWGALPNGSPAPALLLLPWPAQAELRLLCSPLVPRGFSW